MCVPINKFRVPTIKVRMKKKRDKSVKVVPQGILCQKGQNQPVLPLVPFLTG